MGPVLVTGGAGYVGAHACKALAAAGREPVCLDNLSTGWRSAARYGALELCDLGDRAALDAVFARRRPQAVMHFASLSLVGESVARPDLYHRANVTGALNLLDAMRAHGVRAMVFSSTCAIFGEPDVERIGEDAPMAPLSPYGASKLAVERILADYEAAFGLRTAALRYFNVAGADETAEIGERHEPETHLIPLVLDAALGARAAVSVFGEDYPTPDGTCIRDYIHVTDLAEAHVLALDRLLGGEAGLRLNLGAGRGHSVREVIAAARRVTGREIAVRAAPRRAGDPPRLVADGRRAERVLGWRAGRSDIDRMVADAWRWRISANFAATA